MRYRRLGHAGIKVSEIALGAWTTFGGKIKDLEQIQAITRSAYELGINYFDNADVYSLGEAEKLMGTVIGEFPRATLVIASKVFWPMSDDPNDRGLSRKHIRESIDQSLSRLNTDYLDLYFAHRYDPEVEMAEIVSSFSGLVDQGKILYWGTSEWPTERFVEAVTFARSNGLHAPVVEQPQYSMLYRSRVENSVISEVARFGSGLVVWSPLAQGVLSGKYDQEIPANSRLAQETKTQERLLTPENRSKVIRLKPIAEELGITRTQLALAWVLRRPEVASAITGATKPEQVRENAGASGIELSVDVLSRINAILG
jgi:voltage-dependent potassium channel beta subunit